MFKEDTLYMTISFPIVYLSIYLPASQATVAFLQG